MIDIVIDDACLRRMRRELKLAGKREIGGVLAGENLGNGQFRVVSMSVQRAGGSYASFVRDSSLHRRFMRRFFARTGNQPERFNYIGEWHSHPSFLPLPSSTDSNQMQRLIESRDQVAHFLVLLIVKLNRGDGIEASAHAFRRAHLPVKLRVFGGQAVSLIDFGDHGRKALELASESQDGSIKTTLSQGAQL